MLVSPLSLYFIFTQDLKLFLMNNMNNMNNFFVTLSLFEKENYEWICNPKMMLSLPILVVTHLFPNLMLEISFNF